MEQNISKPKKKIYIQVFETIRCRFQLAKNAPDKILNGLDKCKHFFLHLSNDELLKNWPFSKIFEKKKKI